MSAKFLYSLLYCLVVLLIDTKFLQIQSGNICLIDIFKLQRTSNHTYGRSVIGDGIDQDEGSCGSVLGIRIEEKSLGGGDLHATYFIQLEVTPVQSLHSIHVHAIFDFIDGIPEDVQYKPYKAVVTTVYDKSGDGSVDMLDVAELFRSGENKLTKLKGDGDFRSQECLKLMDEADIVVTNPPFSMFREYVAVLMKRKKKFLIIGNQNSITYKEIFPLLMNNEMWLGYKTGDMAFKVPDYYRERETRYWQDENGQKWRSMGNICWFTNLDHNKRHELMDLVCRYTSEDYPKYDNYDAIEVSRTMNIPFDADGVMGVPITFLDKYNPEQFEILGLAASAGYNRDIVGIDFQGIKDARPLIKGKNTYARIFIRNKHPKTL